MLSKLLKTIKSQHSSKSTAYKQQNEKVVQESVQFHQKQINIITKQVLAQLDSQKCQISQSNIKKIRYIVLPNINIMNKVLSCPISVFNYLPYGQRKVKQIDLTKHKFPQYLQFMKPLLNKQLNIYNHILINDYPAGIGIMPHGDGPAYKSKVIVLSLNSFCIINFQSAYMSKSQNERQQQQQQQQQNQCIQEHKQNCTSSIYNCRLLLQPNSIHIFQQHAYSKYLHGIDNYTIDSILLKYNVHQNRVIGSNIANYYQLSCKTQIQHIIKHMHMHQQDTSIKSQQKQRKYDQNGKQQYCINGNKMRIIKLIGNSQYTHKIEIQRKERVSITIRQQYKL